MIPSGVWTNWDVILSGVIGMLFSTQIGLFVFGSMIVTIVANLIYRLTSNKEEQ